MPEQEACLFTEVKKRSCCCRLSLIVRGGQPAFSRGVVRRHLVWSGILWASFLHSISTFSYYMPPIPAHSCPNLLPPHEELALGAGKTLASALFGGSIQRLSIGVGVGCEDNRSSDRLLKSTHHRSNSEASSPNRKQAIGKAQHLKCTALVGQLSG